MWLGVVPRPKADEYHAYLLRTGVPRASKLSVTPTSIAHACSRTKGAAPRSPGSSPSVKSAITSCDSGGPARSARSVSSSTAEPDALSAAAGAAGTPS